MLHGAEVNPPLPLPQGGVAIPPRASVYVRFV
jgi:hypothetical protein